MALVGLIGLCGEGRRRIASAWAFRARAEREARLRFERLGRELEHVGALRIVLERARSAADDEVRHAVICRDTAACYGLDAGSIEPAAARPIGPTRFGARDRLLYELVAYCCVTESLNAALMTETYRRTTVPGVRAAVRAILKDEVKHSQLGWAHLAEERALGRGDFIAESLPRMLAGSVRAELFTEDAIDEGDPSWVAHGELPGMLRLAIFLGAIEEVVFPGLEHFGIDTSAGRQWLRSSQVRGS